MGMSPVSASPDSRHLRQSSETGVSRERRGGGREFNLLFTGRGSSGSYTVRAEQLGAACGAEVKANASLTDCQAADLIVVVKRTPPALLQNIRASKRPWVLDVVDFYPQPASYVWSKSEAVTWVRQQIKALSPDALIWPNRQMAEDCDIALPSVVLKHHHRPGLRCNPIRESVQTVGYEGSARYLERWADALEKECARRGWRFVVNPDDLTALDIVVAFRSGRWDGYVSRHWKSAVKLANAHGSGTPFVGQKECGYLETASGAEYWAETPKELATCFDWLTPQDNRQLVSDRFLQKAYTVDMAAADLKEFLGSL